MKVRKILIILGHTISDGMSGNLADAYQEGALSVGHQVRRINLGDISFDPILHKGYREIQQLEPDLVHAQDDIRWADHIVVVYPNWWSSEPAILKGFFDRMILPGFGFKFEKNSAYRWKKLLSGRTGRIIITMNTSPIVTRILYGDITSSVRRGILWFCGIWPTRVTSFGPTERVSDTVKARWIRKIRLLGTMAR